jgi:hypothetical protein
LHVYRHYILPILASTEPGKTTSQRDDVTRVYVVPSDVQQPNPVESADNIAFAYGINYPPKSLPRDQPGLFQKDGTRKESQ